MGQDESADEDCDDPTHLCSLCYHVAEQSEQEQNDDFENGVMSQKPHFLEDLGAEQG